MSEKKMRAPRTRREAPSPVVDEFTVEALSERTGVSVRNVRAYQTAGLMPPPRLQGRTALYNAEHLGKLELIRELRKQGFKLDTIKDMLTGTPDGAWSEYSLVSHLFSTTFFTVEKPQLKALSEMASHWAQPATQQQKDRLSENGLYRRVGPDEVEMLSPALERIGIQLAELDVPLNTVLDLQDELIRHSRSIARAYVEQLFIAMVRTVTENHALRASSSSSSSSTSETKDDGAGAGFDLRLAEAIKGLFERLRPLAIGSVSAAFPVVLQQEFDRAIQMQLDQARGANTPGN